jgi:hypothetical protein
MQGLNNGTNNALVYNIWECISTHSSYIPLLQQPSHIAPRLPNLRQETWGWEIPSSLRIICIQIVSIVALARGLYYDSIINLEIVACLQAPRTQELILNRE